MTAPRPGSYVHIEFASTDPARTRKFLEDVFSWEFQSMPGMDYHVYATPFGPGGAVMPPASERPGGVLNYVLSEDLDRDVKKIEAAGGRVLQRRHEIPGVGWWALFEDPTGIPLALFESRSPERGPVARFRATPSPSSKRAAPKAARRTRKS
jgi:predicted enzyme related to lactoylglutathione lyase